MTELMALGRTWSGLPLHESYSEDVAVRELRAALELRIAGIRATSTPQLSRTSFRGTEADSLVENAADPTQAGWCYLYNPRDPLAEHYARVLAPLAERRGMGRDMPLLFDGEEPDAWTTWLTDNYQGRFVEQDCRPPRFILILGGPEQVPFRFQALLQTVASVGRLAGPLDDLRTYVEKILRLERADEPAVDREVLFFATDLGPKDPTFHSRRFMVDPLSVHVRDDLRYRVSTLTGDQATKKNLRTALSSRRPALVFTASHGVSAHDASGVIQERYNGAICCQHEGRQTREALFSGDDIPAEGPFLEGAVFFQFACHGYGTPAQSDYRHWFSGFPSTNAPHDFIARLPQRLLAHPRGPIAYVGHVDSAWLQGFTDASEPSLPDRWHKRIAPFKAAVDSLLLRIHPAGYAMEAMSDLYSFSNAVLTNTYDRARREQREGNWDRACSSRFLDNWIRRSDAQNYMVMGDPAAVLRVPR